MERIDIEGQIATAKALATLLSVIPLTGSGPSQIMIFDIHALQEKFYFSDKIILRLETAIPLIIQEIMDTFEAKGEPFSIAFPDEGAEKRFAHLFDPNWKRIVCSKVRNGDKREIKIKEGSPAGKNVIIIDDLVQTGETLLKCGEVLKENGAISVNAFVTHAVFPKKSWEKFTGKNQTFKNFWITDSVPHALEIIECCRNGPFKLLSLANVIVDSLLKI